MTVYADSTLAENEEITFNAGSHWELIRMGWEDVARLVNPIIIPLTTKMAPAAA